MILGMSVLRVAGLAASLVAVAAILWSRRGRFGRADVLGVVSLFCVAAVAAFPAILGPVVTLTGLHGELSRITSLLAVTVLLLVFVVVRLIRQSDHTRDTLFLMARGVAVDAALGGKPLLNPPEIVVLMPAFDEADNLPLVLTAAPSDIAGHSVRVIVIDDGSEDDTAEIATRHGAIAVRSPINAGGGHALQTGFAAARRLGARWAVTMDADGQHRFEDLPTVMAPLLDGSADVVVGSRHLGESVGHQAFRALGLRLFNQVLSALTGRRITDCSSGFRGFDLHATRPLRLRQLRHHTAELILEATRRGLRVSEVPITILPRAHGVSKKGADLLYGARFAATIISTIWHG